MIKVLVIDCEKYFYPYFADTLEQFVEYICNTESRFIKLDNLTMENSIEPYYIREDMKTCYLNVNNISTITEEEVIFLSKEEYDVRLKEVINAHCITCANYKCGDCEDDLKTYRDKLCLDGNCWDFEEIE